MIDAFLNQKGHRDQRLRYYTPEGTWDQKLAYPLLPWKGHGTRDYGTPISDMEPETGYPVSLKETWDQRLMYLPPLWTD